jgi:hypothetical protein
LTLTRRVGTGPLVTSSDEPPSSSPERPDAHDAPVPGEPAATARAPSLAAGTDWSGSPADVEPSPPPIDVHGAEVHGDEGAPRVVSEDVASPVALVHDDQPGVATSTPRAAPDVPTEPPSPPPFSALRVETSEWMPTKLAGRIAAVACFLVLCSYCVATMSQRLAGFFDPWSADGDQAQAVWQYWRYHVAGLFPPGDFLTDYAFKMHAPPVWWALMASGSIFFEPVVVAKFWNVVAYVATLAVTVVGIGRRSNVFVGMAAAFLLARNVDFSTIIAGGYARSFGPMLTMLFLGVFLSGRHRLALAVLVFQAALYPSVVIPCGIAYGIYTVVAGPMPLRLRRMAGMFVAGLLIIVLGKSQDIGAPAWWGPLVTLEEASTMEVWGPGGRVPETPLRPMSMELEKNLSRAWRVSGHVINDDLTSTMRQRLPELPLALCAVGLVAFMLVAIRRHRRGEAVIDPFPWQVPLLIASALVAYVLARQLAFRLYLPYRPLQHVWPYALYATMALLPWAVCVNLLPRRRGLATALTVAIVVLPQVMVWGDGLERGPTTYVSYRWNSNLYRELRALPLNVMVAGDFTNTSSAPLFGHVRVFVNKNLAHPFRLGFWAEAERRILATYQALYATSLDEVLAFAEREKIDYLVWQKAIHQRPEKRLFRPVKKPLDALFHAHKRVGFVLARPLPAEAIAFQDADTVLLDLKKLAALKAAGALSSLPASTTSPPPPPTSLEHSTGAGDVGDPAEPSEQD